MKIRAAELHLMLQTDSHYGIRANAIGPLLDKLKENPFPPQNYDAFRRQYALLPCKGDHQKELILLCCALLPIPAYIGGEQQHWDAADVLAHWNKDFYFLLDDVKGAFAALSLPLPDRLRPASPLSADRPASGSLFSITESSTAFTFTFYGNEVAIKKRKGARYIVELIKNQPDSLSAVDLYYRCNPPVFGLPTEESLGGDTLQTTTDAAPGSPVIDEITLASIKARIEMLSDRIEIATETGNTREVESLQAEQVQCLKYLKQNTKPTGQIIKTSSNIRKINNAISQAIRHSIVSDIQPADERLATHLRNSIHRNHGFTYKPDQHYNWQIN